MNKSRILLALSATVFAFAAQAGGIRASEVPRITNGGSGVIGGVEADAYPRTMNQSATHAGAHASGGMHGSTMPQAQAQSSWSRTMPQAQAQTSWNSTAVMGSARAQSSSDLAARHPAWGTPD